MARGTLIATVLTLCCLATECEGVRTPIALLQIG